MNLTVFDASNHIRKKPAKDGAYRNVCLLLVSREIICCHFRYAQPVIWHESKAQAEECWKCWLNKYLKFSRRTWKMKVYKSSSAVSCQLSAVNYAKSLPCTFWAWRKSKTSSSVQRRSVRAFSVICIRFRNNKNYSFFTAYYF